MDENIIDKVKETLGVNGEYSYIKLLEMLSKKRAECHPDKFSDFEQKQAKEEEFKTLNNLLIQLKRYLEQNNNNLPVVSNYDENGNYMLELIKAIGNISDLNDEIYSLKMANELKDQKIEHLTDTIKKLEEKKYEEENRNIISSLQEIYNASIKSRIAPGISFLILIATQIRYVKGLLTDVFGNQFFIVVLVLCIFIISLLYVIYKSILKYRISYNQNKLINPYNLNKLELHYLNKWHLYFTEIDIEKYIINNINKLDRMIFCGNQEIIYRQLTNFIVLHLNQKKVIESVKAEKLFHIFKINNTSSNEDPLF